MSVNSKIGYGMITISVIFCVLGAIGYTIQDSTGDIPTPSVRNTVFFADEALPSNPFELFITANAEVTWDRNDIFLVIADEGKKDQCSGLTLIEMMGQNSQLCTKDDKEYKVIGDDNINGVSWDIMSEQDYVGIGSFNEMSDGFELNVDYTVKMTLSPTSYFVSFIIIVIGFTLTRYD